MENIIKKAIEGGYDKKYIPVIGIDFPRHHTTITTILMDRDFWQALGKSCGWIVRTTSDGKDIKENPNWGSYAQVFHTVNLTEGFEKAVEYLQNLIEQK